MNNRLPTEPTNVPTDDPMDQRVRTTLQAQYQATEARVANGMVAPRASTPPNADSRPPAGWFLTAAAAAIVLVVAGGLLFSRGDDQVSVDTAGDLEQNQATTVPVEQEPTDEQLEGYLRVNGYAVVQLEAEDRTSFAAVDINDGTVVETFWSEQLEATGFGSLELAADGLSAYLVQWFEDSWFSCGSSLPSIVQLDLAPGLDQADRMIEVARGVEPRVSLDGTKLAYLTASTCVPDPEQPELWVVTVLDTIAVLDLTTGEELRYTLPGLVEAVNAGEDYRGLELRGLLWLDDNRLGVSGEEILEFAGPMITLTGQQLPVLIEPGSTDRLAGYVLAGNSALIEVRDPQNPGVTIGVDVVDLDTGERSPQWRPGDEIPPLGDIDEFGIVADVDTSGQRIYLGPATAPFTRLDLPDGSTFEGPLRIISYSW